jgi:hypothetical protein
MIFLSPKFKFTDLRVEVEYTYSDFKLYRINKKRKRPEPSIELNYTDGYLQQYFTVINNESE